MQTDNCDLRHLAIRVVRSPVTSGWLAASLLATMVGPFGTYVSMSVTERAVYWGGLIGASILLARLAKAWVAKRLTGSRFAVDMASSAIMGLFLGPAVWAYNRYVYEIPADDLPGIGWHMSVVLVVCMVVVLIRLYLQDDEEEEGEAVPRPVPEQEAGAAKPEEEVPFLRRLPRELGNELMHIKADGHYLEVFTRDGKDRILMRFSDALAELDGYDGVRIHRSHWVARHAVSRVEQRGRRVFAVLPCGRRLPVSQAYQQDLPGGDTRF
ncbi:LytTR family transcriptional regulator DNA-binding domain-containing protein [Rhodophyticola porphyridii]|uniref:HTH LytTR-type domain-containing protein n=1 Tax=Rhodophyticola porphyridii TaxID=1852017 RepID=A0A3L9Y914_9RHOB|nr:LytTR family transcriptional regulator DNA-binding domain-containing protein [Rhodophyticola porphyridii]RMA44025.1 hypothetical protein D9R08_03710 [Rhodophyticola porphyridii]